jgi:hypothetical protein
MVEYEKLRELVNDCETDLKKFEGGNKAAGTRIRKAMQEIKNQAQEVRKAVMALRGE